jgi:hypothetical protein
MQTIVVEIDNPKAFALLQELEELNILKIVKQNILKSSPKLSQKYKGVFTKQDAKNFDEHTQSMRKEWDNI